MKKIYLGDSVYAELSDCGEIILTTENGYHDDPRNRIVMDYPVIYAFERFIGEVRRSREPLPHKDKP